MIANAPAREATASELDPQHVRRIAANTVRGGMRAGSGIIFALAVFYIGLTPCAWMLTLDVDAVVQRLNTDLEPWVLRLLGGARPDTAGDEAGHARWLEADMWRRYLVEERPVLLTIDFALLMVLVPLLYCLGSFGVIADDARSYALRFDLMRTSRVSLYLGRYAGTALFTTAMLALVIVFIVVYLGLRVERYGWEELSSWGGRGLLAVVALGLPYVALAQWISSEVDSSFGSLLVAELAVICVPAFALAGKVAWEPLGNLVYLIPIGIHHYFFHPDPGRVAGAAAACLGYTALFLALGLWRFRRRDL